MAQGKMKVKAKVPDGKRKKGKGNAATQRSNKPIQPKKHRFEEAHKLKQAITKTVNKSVEQEMRDRVGTKQTLSKAQEAVASFHQKQGVSKK